MKDINAIFLDLDGTLLDDNKNITDFTKKMINKCIDKNIKIVLSSARGFYRVNRYIKELGIDQDNNYSICYNGAVIITNTGREIYSSNIDNKLILLLTKFILNYDMQWYYYLYDTRVLINDIENIDEFISNNKVYKIVGVSTIEQIKEIKDELPDEIKDNLEFTSGEEHRISFMSKGINKVKGIKLILDKFNILPENVLAIGDGQNDIEMLKFVKYGVAMANSPNIVKNNINDIGKYTNNEDGVGHIIKGLFD